MFSARFQLPVHLTHHATQRMVERAMSKELVLELIDTGTLKMKDAEHGWAWKVIAGRNDNALCAAIQIGTAVTVKTVMHHFEGT